MKKNCADNLQCSSSSRPLHCCPEKHLSIFWHCVAFGALSCIFLILYLCNSLFCHYLKVIMPSRPTSSLSHRPFRCWRSVSLWQRTSWRSVSYTSPRFSRTCDHQESGGGLRARRQMDRLCISREDDLTLSHSVAQTQTELYCLTPVPCVCVHTIWVSLILNVHHGGLSQGSVSGFGTVSNGVFLCVCVCDSLSMSCSTSLGYSAVQQTFHFCVCVCCNYENKCCSSVVWPYTRVCIFA